MKVLLPTKQTRQYIKDLYYREGSAKQIPGGQALANRKTPADQALLQVAALLWKPPAQQLCSIGQNTQAEWAGLNGEPCPNALVSQNAATGNCLYLTNEGPLPREDEGQEVTDASCSGGRDGNILVVSWRWQWGLSTLASLYRPCIRGTIGG